MFAHFDIRYPSDTVFDYMDHYHIGTSEVEAVFYGEHHVFYPARNQQGMVIGYSGLHMLGIDFLLDFDKNLIIIERISISTAYEISQFYCGRVF